MDSGSPAQTAAPLGREDPKLLGPYRIKRRIGVGGMGIVYLGQSEGGLVAVKVIHPDLMADESFRKRFRREADAASRVTSRYCARVIATDVDADPPWIASTYVKGHSLQEHVSRNGPLGLRATYALAWCLTEALVAIHDAGLIHRDFKPCNILLTEDGACVIDFGIALSSGQSRITGTDDAVGTAGYTAPERLTEGVEEPSGDMFSLGAVLVYASSGHEMVSGTRTMTKRAKLLHRDFDLSGVPRDILPIVRRCIDVVPEMRPSARGLRAELAGMGVQAPASGWLTAAQPNVIASAARRRFRRLRPRRLLALLGLGSRSVSRPLVRRYRLITALGLALALGVGVAVANVVQDARADRERAANQERERLLAIVGRVRSDATAIQAAEPTKALALQVATYAIMPDGQGEAAILETIRTTAYLGRIGTRPAEMFNVIMSRDGSRVAVMTSTGTTVWDVKDPTRPVQMGALPAPEGSGPSRGTFADDGRRLILEELGTDSRDEQISTLAVYDVSTAGTPRQLARAALPGEIEAWAVSADGRSLATTLFPADLPDRPVVEAEQQPPPAFLWDLSGLIAGGRLGTPAALGDERGIYVDDWEFSADGKVLAITGRGTFFALWDVTDAREPHRKLVQRNTKNPDAFHNITLARDSHTLALLDDDGEVQVWDIDQQTPKLTTRQLPNGGHDAIDIEFSQSRDLLFTWNGAGTVIPWNVADLAGPGQIPPGRTFEAGPKDTTRAPDAPLLVATSEQPVVLTTGADVLIIRSLDPQPPLPPVQLVERACRLSGRGLSRDLWEQYIPEVPYRQVCSEQ